MPDAHLSVSKSFLVYTTKTKTFKTKIPGTVFSEYEIVDPETLGHLIANFIKTNLLVPAKLTLTLDPDLAFSHPFKNLDEAIDDAPNFIANVPLENTANSLVKTAAGYQLYVVSQKIIQTLKNSLQSQKFKVKLNPSFSPALPSAPAPKNNLLNKIRHYLPYIAAVVVALIIVILIISRIKTVSHKKNLSVPTPTIVKTIPTIFEASPSAIKLQLIYQNPKTIRALDKLKNALSKNGYTNQNLVNDTTISPSKTYLIFPTVYTQSQKDPLIKIISGLYVDVTIQESNDLPVDSVQIKSGQMK